VDLLPLKHGVFDDKRILLSWTLSLYGSRREAVEMGIRRAEGVRYPGDHDDDLSTGGKERRWDKKEARTVNKCDILITRWRNGKAYGKVNFARFIVGPSKSSSIGVQVAQDYRDYGMVISCPILAPRPVDQLLHYPIPRRPIPNFLRHVCPQKMQFYRHLS